MWQRIRTWVTEKRRLRALVRRLEERLDGHKQEMERVEAQKRDLSSHLSTLNTQLAAERTHRSLAWPKPARRMKERDVLGEFDVPIDEPWFVALHQELDDAIGDLLDEVTQAPSATLTTERRTHIAGGAEALREFQKRLLELQHRAANTDDELEESEKTD